MVPEAPDTWASDAAFPKRRLSAGVLLRDAERRLLVVKPSYRSDWLLPGGVVEASETPAQAAVRETLEETGLHIRVRSLLAIDALGPQRGLGASIHFLFDCVVPGGDAGMVVALDGIEIVDARFVDAGEAAMLLAPSIERRLRHVLDGAHGYFEDGEPVASFQSLHLPQGAMP